MNALQNTLRNADCLIRTLTLSLGRLEHDHARLVLKEPSRGFDIETPQPRHFSRRGMALICDGRLRHRGARKRGEAYLPRDLRKNSDCRSLYATYRAAGLSPHQRRRYSMISQPALVCGTVISCHKRKYRRDPTRNDSAALASRSLSASSWLTCATNAPFERRTGIPLELARLVGGAE